MIGTIRKHNKLLWAILVPLTILSFVIYFLPNFRNGGNTAPTSGANLGAVNGEPITVEQLQAAMREAKIIYRLNNGTWPDTSEERNKQIRSIAEQRLVLNSELEDYHISVSTDAAARFLRQMLGVKPGDNVPAERIVETLTKLGQDAGITLDDFDRFARHQAGQEYLMSLIGMTGKLITPQEAAVFYQRENEPMQTEIVTFLATNYYTRSAPTKKEVETFYTNHVADYRIPDQITVNYVQFDVGNYTAKAQKQMGTNIDAQIDGEYMQAGPANFKDESGKQLSPEAAKAKIKKEMLQYYSMLEARKEANAFMNELSQGHDDDHPYTQTNLLDLAKTHNFVVKTTAPFDLKTLPKELDVSVKAAGVLFAMRSDDPDDKERSMIYTPSPLIGTNAIYVVGLHDRIPSTIQPLSAVYDKVVQDYRDNSALELAKDAGKRFQDALSAGMQQGKTFDTMAAAQFVRPRSLPAFSLATPTLTNMPDNLRFDEVQELAGRMHPGQFSPFIPTPDGGFFLYLKGTLPLDQSAMQRNLPVFLERMRDKLQIAAFNAWFSKQFQTRYSPPAGEYPSNGG